MCFMIYLVDWLLSLSLMKAVSILSLCAVTGNALAPAGADTLWPHRIAFGSCSVSLALTYSLFVLYVCVVPQF